VHVDISEKVVAPPTGYRRSAPGAVTAVADRLRLARFAGALVVKEHLAPRLHVRPLVAELFLTDNCNLRCVSCACWRTTTRGELTTREWRDVLGQLAAMGIVKANFTGGEPLLRADAPALMAHATEVGIRHLHLNTNAVLLDDRRLDAVLAAGVRSFNVSVDGPDAATHEAVRGVAGSFDRTLAHLGALVQRRPAERLRVRMNFTVMRANLASLPDMVRLAQRLEVPLSLNLTSDTTFLFRHADVAEQARLDTTELDDVLAEVEHLLRHDARMLPPFSQWRFLRRYFTEPAVRTPPCAESQLKLLVRSTGDVGGCWGHDGVVNVRDRPLADIVAGGHYRDEHARLYRKDCVGCGSNYALNVRLRPTSHLHDRLWRLGRRRLTDLRDRP
jgi:MoaA/NifB/PqqE/SkfB family radical SAM enzyme